MLSMPKYHTFLKFQIQNSKFKGGLGLGIWSLGLFKVGFGAFKECTNLPAAGGFTPRKV